MGLRSETERERERERERKRKRKGDFEGFVCKVGHAH